MEDEDAGTRGREGGRSAVHWAREGFASLSSSREMLVDDEERTRVDPVRR
jgi:hypothetical protein